MDNTQVYSLDLEIKKYLPFVKNIAFKILRELPDHVILDDLIQDGCLGLLDALKGHDPSRGASFKTYARIRIRGAILDGLRRSDTQLRSVRKKAKDIKKAESTVEKTKKRKARPKEIAEEMGISIEELSEITLLTQRSILISVGDNLANDVPGSSELEHFISPEEHLERTELLSAFQRTLQNIPGEEQQIFELYHKKGVTQKDIARLFGMSEPKICYTIKKTMLKAKAISLLENEENVAAVI